MNLLKITNSNRKWYQVIGWWEVRRIAYNVIMYFAGLLSFQIAYVTIPLIYIIIGFIFNVVYTFGWIAELLFIVNLEDKNTKLKYAPFALLCYLFFSMLLVFAFPILLLTR